MDPGGLEVLEAGPEEFAARLKADRHTLKRALTDPHLFSGIGNGLLRRDPAPREALAVCADPIAFRRGHPAPLRCRSARPSRMDRAPAPRGGTDLPEKVTAFREEMAVHGRYRKPCPVCGSPVQRIVYAENETNYCARCQTGGKILADRALSRLLKASWPRSIDELE